jgi:preprotein translocase subunit YajC
MLVAVYAMVGRRRRRGQVRTVSCFRITIRHFLLLIRPQQKKAKEHKAVLDNLKKGDSVITSGGIYGTIFSLTPTHVVLIISENVKIKVARSYIAGLASSEESSEEK